jgi:tRNA(Ile)-lysidine synthase
MLDSIKVILQENCCLKPDQPIVVGVSGGPDSLCLMDILYRAGYPLVIAHLNHGLRPEADEDVREVEQISSRLNLPLVVKKEDVRGLALAESLSIEEAARLLRYRFLMEQARANKAQAVAVGHTADDQVETVLMNFVRGAGLTGLKGMTCRKVLPEFDPDIPIVRPLLNVWREETVVYCAAHGLRPVFDQSNATLDYTRNRIRHLLIPELESYNPRFREALWRTSQSLAADYQTMQEIMNGLWEHCIEQQKPGYVIFKRAEFVSQPAGLQRNLLRRALQQIRPGLQNINFAMFERALSLAADARQTDQVELVGGTRLLCEGQRIYVANWEANLPFGNWPQLEGEPQTLGIPGQIDLPNGWILTCQKWELVPVALQQAQENKNPFQVWLDADKLSDDGELQLRTRRPGDLFQPLGLDGHSMKLSDFEINVKMPRRARAQWPLVAMGETIIWLPGYRPAHPFRLTETTDHVFYMELGREKPKAE